MVCPVTLMGQWADELADKTKGRLKVLLHHGNRRSKDPADLAACNIIVGTGGNLACCLQGNTGGVPRHTDGPVGR